MDRCEAVFGGPTAMRMGASDRGEGCRMVEGPTRPLSSQIVVPGTEYQQLSREMCQKPNSQCNASYPAAKRRMGGNPLASNRDSPHFGRAMKRWTPRQVIALLLGVMFALGTTLSTVQAADMAVKMSADSTMGTAAAPDPCGPCGSDDEAANAGSCVMVCPSSVQAVGPAAGPVVLTGIREARPLSEFALAGRSSHPDPYPPKPVILI